MDHDISGNRQGIMSPFRPTGRSVCPRNDIVLIGIARIIISFEFPISQLIEWITIVRADIPHLVFRPSRPNNKMHKIQKRRQQTQDREGWKQYTMAKESRQNCLVHA